MPGEGPDGPSCRELLDALPYPALLLDGQGAVVAFNPEVERSLGVRLADGDAFFDEALGLTDLDHLGPLYRARFAGREPGWTFEIVGSDGGEDRYRIHVRPLGDRPVAMVLLERIAGDVELQRTIQHLEQQLDEVRRIKHDMSSPLMGLLGTAELLKGYPELSEESRRKVETILEESRRITAQLRELSCLRDR